VDDNNDNTNADDNKYDGRSRWPRALRCRGCGSSLAGIASSNPGGGMDVCHECCVLSGRGLCIGPNTRPEESYRVWRV